MRLPYKGRLEKDRLGESKKYRGSKSRARAKEDPCQHKYKKNGKKLHDHVEKPQNNKVIPQKERGGDQIKIGRAVELPPCAVGTPQWIFTIGNHVVHNEIIPIYIIERETH